MQHRPRGSVRAFLRSLLAMLIAVQLACSVIITDSGTFVLIGVWGGEHARLELGEDGGTLEYDCAHGTIAPGWTLSDDGEFDGIGEHYIEHGGPVSEGEIIPPRPARYTGTVGGDRFDLTVVLTDSAQTIGTFEMQRDSDGVIRRCL